MVKPVSIKNKIIGEGYPTFLIAEMACSHQGVVRNVNDLVDIAIKSKADAIQLQVFKTKAYMSPIYKDYDLIKRLEISHDEWSKVIDLIKKKNILLFATGDEIESVQFLINKDIDGFKVHSADISNPELLIKVAKSKKLVFLSCGASTIEEIKKAIELLRSNGTEKIILMYGYQAFPTKIEESNLNYLKTLEKIFELNVGFYDHVNGGSILSKIIPIMAIGYGAQVIEKHFTLTRADKGIDYESSLEPEDFIDFIKILRQCENAIGSKEIRDFSEGELEYRAYCKKSIVAKNYIPKGSKITRENVMFLRNNPGIPPDKFKEIEGKIVKNDIKKYYNIKYQDF